MFVSLRTCVIRSLNLTLLLIVSLTFANVAFGQAQSAAADLQGVVKDATGAVVPDAAITARHAGTNVRRAAVSNDEGFYRIVNLAPGEYEITVEAANFKKAVLAKVIVTVGQTATVDVALEPGQITGSVTISDGTAEIVE